MAEKFLALLSRLRCLPRKIKNTPSQELLRSCEGVSPHYPATPNRASRKPTAPVMRAAIYFPLPAIPSPVSSTFCSRAAIIVRSHPGTGAPRAPAFSMMLPASVRMYQMTTKGQSSTV